MDDANFASPMPHSENFQGSLGISDCVPTLRDVSVGGTKPTATSRSPYGADMKSTDPSESPEGKRQQVLLPDLQVEKARDAKVPVVVLGATIGGLATALAIRSRTGRAVCVIDIEGKDSEPQASSMFCLLSARSLDAMRAINTDLHRAVIDIISKETATTPSFAAATEWAYTGPLRISCLSLKNLLVDHLTAGAGGRSWLWCSNAVKHICVESPPEDASKMFKKTNIHFADNVILKTDLVVVANSDFPVVGGWREQADDLLCVEGAAPLPHKVNDGFWTFRNSNGLRLSLLTEAEKPSVFFVASSPVGALKFCPENPHPEAAAIACRIVEALLTENPASASDNALLSAVFDAIEATPNCVTTSRGINSEASWSFWGGRLVLTGAAAHPWDAPLADSLELALEDAAQLGCSLFDWKFTFRLASDRFQSIRKRRLASLLSVPKVAKSSLSDSSDVPCGTSTAAVSPDLKTEDQMFVPTRDAYAELLPSAGVGYEVEEAEIS